MFLCNLVVKHVNEFKKVHTEYPLKLNVVTRDFHFMNAKWQTAASQSLKATAAVDSELSGRLSLNECTGK